MRPRLELVGPTTRNKAKPYDAAAGRRGLIAMRASLTRGALRYIVEGPTRAEQKERLREASDLTGIPRTILETVYAKLPQKEG